MNMNDNLLQKGLIFNKQKFSIHDGIGIRTLVFMKGCPIRCIWCSNPESQLLKKEIMDVSVKCIGCNKCINLCPKGAISSQFEIKREECDACGKCVEKCYANAKKTVGNWETVFDVVSEIEKDIVFYRNSGGGVTIGGGEPLLQYDFVKEVFLQCKKLGIHTAIETCGYADWEVAKGVFEYVDQVFYDLKHMDSKKHKELTGVGNNLILENAKKMTDIKNDITFRVPLIPGLNDDKKNIHAIGLFVSDLMKKGKEIKIEILPYHNLGGDKYKWLSKEYELSKKATPREGYKEVYEEILKSYGCDVV